MNWRIFYNDKAIDECDKPPARGVQVIIQHNHDVGVEIVTGADYYVREGNRWRGVDIFGLFDYLIESGMVLFGRTITQDEYNAVMRRALADQHEWKKTGYLPRERKHD